MTTSPATSSLFDPSGEERIPLGVVAYFRERNRNRLYDLVVREFQKSGLNQAALARRLGKRPEVVSRLIGAPGNWTLDTVSDLLLAISAGEAEYSVAYPFQEPPRNMTEPAWLAERRGRPNDFAWVENYQRDAAGSKNWKQGGDALVDQLKGMR